MKQGSEGRARPVAARETPGAPPRGFRTGLRGHVGAKEQGGGTIHFQPEDLQSSTGLRSLLLGEEGPCKSTAKKKRPSFKGQTAAQAKGPKELFLQEVTREERDVYSETKEAKKSITNRTAGQRGWP